MARNLGISEPTLKDLIRKNDDFPILERGRTGQSWRFDPKAVARFLKKKQKAEAGAKSTREARLGQQEMVLTPKTGGALDDQLKTYKIRDLERIDAKENGRLAVAEEVSAALASTFRRLAQMQDTGIERVGRMLNLPDAVMRALRREMADIQVAFVRDAAEFLTADDKAGLIA